MVFLKEKFREIKFVSVILLLFKGEGIGVYKYEYLNRMVSIVYGGDRRIANYRLITLVVLFV